MTYGKIKGILSRLSECDNGTDSKTGSGEINEARSTAAERKKRKIQAKKRKNKPKDPKRVMAAKKARRKHKSSYKKGAKLASKTRARFESVELDDAINRFFILDEEHGPSLEDALKKVQESSEHKDFPELQESVKHALEAHSTLSDNLDMIQDMIGPDDDSDEETEEGDDDEEVDEEVDPELDVESLIRDPDEKETLDTVDADPQGDMTESDYNVIQAFLDSLSAKQREGALDVFEAINLLKRNPEGVIVEVRVVPKDFQCKGVTETDPEYLAALESIGDLTLAALIDEAAPVVSFMGVVQEPKGMGMVVMISGHEYRYTPNLAGYGRAGIKTQDTLVTKLVKSFKAVLTKGSPGQALQWLKKNAVAYAGTKLNPITKPYSAQQSKGVQVKGKDPAPQARGKVANAGDGQKKAQAGIQ